MNSVPADVPVSSALVEPGVFVGVQAGGGLDRAVGQLRLEFKALVAAIDGTVDYMR